MAPFDRWVQLKIKELEHVLIEKVEQLFQHMLSGRHALHQTVLLTFLACQTSARKAGRRQPWSSSDQIIRWPA
jgi:hypothetical protein